MWDRKATTSTCHRRHRRPHVVGVQGAWTNDCLARSLRHGRVDQTLQGPFIDAWNRPDCREEEVETWYAQQALAYACLKPANRRCSERPPHRQEASVLGCGVTAGVGLAANAQGEDMPTERQGVSIQLARFSWIASTGGFACGQSEMLAE